MKNKAMWLIFSIVICQSAGLIGSFFTTPAISAWYNFLAKPSFSPPNWIFGPVWITLYTLMGVSLYLIIRERERFGVYVFLLHLILNAGWSILFFGLRNPGAAFLEIIALWSLILFLIVYFYKIKKTAAYLLIPYFLWVSFAAILNFSLWRLN